MRVASNLKAINPRRYDTDSFPNESPLLDMTAWRDTLRARFTAEGVAAQMKASDIFTWTGSSNYTGYGFTVEDITNNTQMIIMTGGNHTNAPGVDDWLGGSGANLRTHVKAVGDAAGGTTNPQNGVVFLFNPDTTTAAPDLEFDNATEKTYSGGDGFALTVVNPDSLAGLAALRPPHCRVGVSFEEPFSNSAAGYYSAIALVYDDELLTWAVYSNQRADWSTSFIAMFGDWIVPQGGDTDPLGHLRLQFTRTANNVGTIQHAKVEAADAGGTERTYDLVPQVLFDEDNYVISSGPNIGKIDWRNVTITNGTGGSGTKGTTDERACVEVFPNNDARFTGRPQEMPDAARIVAKQTDTLAFLWQNNYELPLSYGRGE